jgi:pyruvate dehydrogenase E1 component alpha subunit
MRTIRAFEEHAAIEFAAGNIPGFVHLYSGQEACAVGMCMNLTDEDVIGSTHRGHGHCIAKGCDVEGMMHEIFGRKTGLCGGKGGSMHIADMSKGMLGANGIVGGNPPLAVGAALAARVQGKNSVAVSFAGDGSSNQGTTFEAMNLAVVLKLPVIFVVENNGYGEGTPASYAVGAPDVAKRAEAFGMPAVSIDGTDFFTVFETCREIVEKARNGGGPAFIEMKAPRFHGHFEGDPQLYRGPGEIEHDRAERDCIKIFKRKVSEAHLLEDSQLSEIDHEIEKLMDACTRSASEAAWPTERDLSTHVYTRY